MMAWQDFCHFPSYEIPATLYRLREHFEFVEAPYPGSTLVFRVKSLWEPEEATADALALKRWTPAEIAEAYAYWTDGKVRPEKRDVFLCGQAMFLCDIGFVREAVAALQEVWRRQDKAVVRKWAYLRERRRDFVKRYAPLFAVAAC
jgi:hypothetical protein